MNFLFVLYFLLFITVNINKVKRIYKRLFYLIMNAIEMFVISFLFAAFGWWYYATISIIMFLIILSFLDIKKTQI